ncbi:hypothetical protein VCHC62A1_1533B, partial [Vibrio cholerae HC-62A1]
IHNTH